MKFNDIVDLAEKVIENVETKQSASVTKTKNYSTLANLFSKAILNLDKATGIVYVPENPKPQSSYVNGGVGRNNYKYLCELMKNWVNKHGEAPAYLRFNQHKISIWAWAYATARILVHYRKYKELPKKILVTEKPFIKKNKTNTTNKECNNPYKSTPHPTESGCDGMGQNTGYYCGVCALQHSLYKFGIDVSQSTLASWAGTTTSGTSHDGIRSAVEMVNRKFNVNISVSEKSFSELGILGLAKLICQYNVDVISHVNYRNTWGHYESINEINVETNMFKILNSLGDMCYSGCYCGYVEERSLAEEKSYIDGISQKSIIILTKN